MRSLKPREVLAALKLAGFEIARQSGSHVILKKDGHPSTVSVPCHGGRDIKKGTLRGIISSAGLTPENFTTLLAGEVPTAEQPESEPAD